MRKETHLELKSLLSNEIDPAFAKRAAFIFRAIEQKKPKRVLDVGCGRGFYINALARFSFIKEIHGVDINKEYIIKAKSISRDKRINLTIGRIEKLAFPDKYFDFIICSEVLEHLENDEVALMQLRRLLKTGGSLAITVPNLNFPFFWDPLNWLLMRIFRTHISKDIWWLAGIWADHERLYTREGITKKIKRFFSIKIVEEAVHNCWPFSHFLLYGIGKNIVEKLGIKTFNRFNFQEKSKARILAEIFQWPSRFSNKSAESSVNICIIAER